MTALFVTGTDTDVGKTHVAVALLRGLVNGGFRAAGMKPVAAGFAHGEDVNPDVAALRAASNVDAPIGDVNPYVFADPVAPHLAAEASGVAIRLPVIVEAFERLRARADALVVEGAGGALVPLDRAQDMLDIAAALKLPVLLVVGMRLGCLNHALLTALAVQRRGLALAGWIANELPPGMPLLGDNIRTLTARLGTAPIDVVEAGHVPVFDPSRLSTLGFTRETLVASC
ncbi:MAG TPA: dethiobiotin synthase [Casimicrobiaceae bacterium]|nr:dethiobiotin synthase [Casimicrobiaceae bacterium]